MQIKFSLPRSGPYLGWRVASIVVIGMMCSSIVLSCYFLYQNIFRVLDDANTIIILNSSVGFDSIDVATFNQSRSVIDAKNNLPTLALNLRNIFNYGPTSTPHSNVTSTPTLPTSTPTGKSP